MKINKFKQISLIAAKNTYTHINHLKNKFLQKIIINDNKQLKCK